MKGSSIFLLLFGIILFGLAYYFLQYTSEEGFQVSDLPFELSDVFLDNTLNPVVADFTSYGYNLYIINDFINFITDPENYDKPRIWKDYGGFGYWLLNRSEFKNVSDKIRGYASKQDIKFRKNFNIWDTTTLNTKINPTNYLPNNLYCVSNITDIYSGYHFKASYSNYSDFVINMTNQSKQKLRLYVYGTFCNYHSNDFQECIHWGGALNFSNVNNIESYLNIPFYDPYMNGSNVSYSYGNFYSELVSRGGAQSYLYDVDVANNLSNTIYNGLRNYSLNTLKIPNSNAPNTISIAIPRYNPNGSQSYTTRDISYYTIGSTSNISDLNLQQRFVGKMTPQIMGKMPNMMRRYITSWTYNRTQRTLDARLGDSRLHWHNDANTYNIHKAAYLLMLATNNWQKAIYDNNTVLAASWSNYLTKYLYTNMTAQINAGWIGNTAINEIQNRDCVPVTMDGYSITNPNSFCPNYNINILATVALFGKYNDATYGKATQFVYSKGTNRYWGGRGAIPPHTQTAAELSEYFYYTINTTGSNPNHAYNTTGPNTWDLTDNTIGLMTADFKANMSKLLPDYGIASAINILDHKMLDSIAQSFYEYSDGLFEITNIYDLYLVGSNMMDLRFDKKQRLAPDTYVSLRNQYIPQINAYNNLLDIYNNGTWVETYSNIKDLQSNISTSLKRLEPILNPIYATSNANPDTLRAQIGILTNANITLQNEIDFATLTTASQISTLNANSNKQGLSNLLQSGNSVDKLADLNSQLNSNTNTINTLSQQIDGIETNVARVFFTMSSSSNIVINGIALGPNAALTYNPYYCAGLQLDMGQSLGNINYSPTIIYTKNVIPDINPSNINFIKQAAQLYMDGIATNLSTFTRDTFRNSNGIVRVDKVYGFTKLDDITCGFTWQESQYDFYTNKPNVRRIVDVVLKFAFDNIEYQNPQIYIDNKVSNIYINSSNLDVTASEYYVENTSNIQKYNSRIIGLRNDINTLQINNSNIVTTLSNYLYSNKVGYQVYARGMSYVSNVNNPAYGDSFRSNFYNLRYKDYSMLELFNYNSIPFTFDNIKEYLLTTNNITEGPLPSNVNSIPENIELSNYDNWIAPSFLDSSAYPTWSPTTNYIENNIVKHNSNYYYAKRTNNNAPPDSTVLTSYLDRGQATPIEVGILYWGVIFPEVNYAITSAYPTNAIKNKIDAIRTHNKNINSERIQYSNSINGAWMPNNASRTVYGNNYVEYLTIERPNTYKGITNKIINYRLNLNNLYTSYSDNQYRINLKNIEIRNINNTILTTSNLENNISNTYANGRFKFGILQNNNGTPFTFYNYLNENKGEVYYPPFQNSNIDLNTRMTNTNVSNAYVIIPWEPQEEEQLDNNDGACPANIFCGNPQVMNQLMDSYNLDSNNNDKIVRIFKGFTPNGFQCDYSVELLDNSNRTKKGTISFQVVQNIEDCSYVIASNSGFNTGYYIIDKVKYVKDSATDISGYQYITANLKDFQNNVNSLTYLRDKAFTAGRQLINAVANSRALTFTSLGKLNTISNIASCENLNYDRLSNILKNDQSFLFSILKDSLS